MTFNVMRLSAIFLLVGVSCTLAAPTDQQTREKKYLSLEEILTQKFTQKSLNATWISGSELLYKKKGEGGMFLFDVPKDESSLFITNSVLDSLNTTNVILSPDRKFILARSDPQTGFRYSSAARYALHDLQRNVTTLIADHKYLQSCVFGGEEHAVAFVLENDVFYLRDAATSVVEDQLTTDGVPGIVYNGVPDWVYEEEVFGSGSALWFSKNGARLAMASFNDTKVDTAFYMSYGLPGSIEDQYPKKWDLKYPKVGRTNPTVSLKVMKLETSKEPKWVTINAPVDEVTDDHILGTVTWANDNEVVALWLNRRQNKTVLSICNADTGDCIKNFRTNQREKAFKTNEQFKEIFL